MTKVKICGITNLEDAQVAVEAGADMLGFIFYPSSPRYVRLEVVREIVGSLKRSGFRVRDSALEAGAEEKNINHHVARPRHPVCVGVFVNESLANVQHALDFCGLDLAQLHGDEPPEFVAALADRAYKALWPQSLEEALDSINSYQSPEEVSLSINKQRPTTKLHPSILLDAYHPNLYGGTGRVTDWSMAAQMAALHKVLLAGSLTPENVAEAVRVVNPWGVDVSSGVEARKGKKDWQKVRAFVANAKTG